MAFLVDRKFFVSKWRRYRINQRRVVVAESVEKGDVHFHKSHEDHDGEIAILGDDENSGAWKRQRKEEISMASAALKEQQSAHKGADKQMVRKFAAYQVLEDTPKSRAFYRVNAIRRFTGSRGVLPVKPKTESIRVMSSPCQ